MVQRVITCSLSLLLLAAAGLKLYGLNVQPVAQHAVLLHPSMQFAVVEWEIVLAIWMLSGRAPVAGWGAAVLTFLAFASVSLQLGIHGQESCGCFGTVKASPWHALVIDAFVLILLAIGWPDFRNLSQLTREEWLKVTRRGFGVALGVVACCAVVIGIATYVYGSPEEALAQLRRERVSIRPGVVDVGSEQEGQELETVVEIVNRTGQPVRIFGGTSDCSCVATVDLPLTLAPGEMRQVSVKVRLPRSPGFFNRKAWFWTDCDQAPTVMFGVAGRIKPQQQDLAGVSVK